MQNHFWKYTTKEACNEFLLSLRLLNNNWSNNQKITCLYIVSNNLESHYQKISIPKKNGTSRILHIPDYLLKEIQKNMLKYILNQYPISKYATAYHKNTNILKNALPHLQKKLVLKLDIKDFFHHITFNQVKEVVFPGTIYPPPVQHILTEFCCYQGSIPQGAPTSAAISNLIMKEFDETIGMWCENKNISYTRYCDDFTFSGDFHPDEVIKKVIEELKPLQLQLNINKTKILRPYQRQIVTGIVVNQKPHTPRIYRRKIRQEMYYIKQYGVKEHLLRTKQVVDSYEYIQSLLGKINFVLLMQPNDLEFKAYKNWIQKKLKNL